MSDNSETSETSSYTNTDKNSTTDTNSPSILDPSNNTSKDSVKKTSSKDNITSSIDDTPSPALDVAESLLGSSKKIKKRKDKDDDVFNVADYEAGLKTYNPRSSKKRASTRQITDSEGEPKKKHRRGKSRHMVESVDALTEKKSKRMQELTQSLSFDISNDDSDSNERVSPLKPDNNEDNLLELYKILKPTSEEIDKVATLNTDPFPKEEEWKIEEGAKFPGCASFTQLMLYLTQIDTVNIDFQKIFLVTFPSFASPRQLLTAIFKRYYVDMSDEKCNVPDDKILEKMRLRIIRVLQFWINLVPYQFDDTMVRTLNEFYKILQEEFKRQKKDKQSPVLTILEQRMIKLTEYKNNQAANISNCPKMNTDAKPGKGKSKWTTLMPDPNTLAEQVTLLHSEIFRNIGVMELLSAIWGSKKGGGSEHVDELTKHFDLMSRYVQFSIIAERDSAKDRADLFLYWLEVGIRFFKDANYHGVFAIIYGLTHRSVQRMPQTMKSVEKLLKKKKRKEEYDKLVKLCDIAGNYRAYRPLIEKEIAGPIIPFIGCFQKDLIYAQEGFPNKIDNLINFNKLIKCYELISIVEKYQNEKYKFTRNEEFQQAICSFPELPDTTGMMYLSQEKEKKAK